ncbi:alpha/beta fold hydrolase [Lentzea sp. JNUCC 0626]|uniref:alpha/beta fold hydrolase n=1 Tax=Lentzea sp. JNUCC 0626 TaxID=3367513 RepID=UPI003749354C
MIIPGPMERASEFEKLANALGEHHTVHVLDRRGRGDSGPVRPGHGLRTEVEDVKAVLAATGARRLLGVSTGALIALETALRTPDVTRVIAYEPPIGAHQRKAKVIARFEREITEGRTEDAAVTLIKGLEIGPRVIRRIPRVLFTAMLRRSDDEEKQEMAEILPSLSQDLRLAREASENPGRFRALRQEVVLVGGAKSPDYLTEGLYLLADLLPHAEKVLVEEAHHLSPSAYPHHVLPAFESFLHD